MVITMNSKENMDRTSAHREETKKKVTHRTGKRKAKFPCFKVSLED